MSDTDTMAHEPETPATTAEPKTARLAVVTAAVLAVLAIAAWGLTAYHPTVIQKSGQKHAEAWVIRHSAHFPASGVCGEMEGQDGLDDSGDAGGAAPELA